MRHYVFLFLLLTFSVIGIGTTEAQVDELRSKYAVKVSSTSAYTLKEDQWYLLYNRGRDSYNFEDSSRSNGVFQSTNGIAAGSAITENNAGYLVQLVARGEEYPGEYYIYTGHDHWYGDLTQNSQPLSTTVQEQQRAVFTITKLKTSGHWYLRSKGGYILDGNGNGSTVVGYGTDAPTATNGNNDHAFYAVTIGTEDELTGGPLANRQLTIGGLFRFTSQRSTSMSITDPSDHKLVSQATKSDNHSQWWLVQPLANGGIALRNYATGLYMQATSGGSVQYTTSGTRSTLYAKASVKATATKGLVTISSKSSFADKSCLHDDASHKVVNWYANNANGENPYSDWGMTAIENLTPDVIKDHFDEVSGCVQPAAGLTIQIRNAETGWQISEDGNGKLLALEPNTSDYSQYWVMQATTDGNYTFRNVKTGHYFNFSSGTGNTSAQSTSTTSRSSYTLTETSDRWERTYHISSVSSPQLFYKHTIPSNAPTGTPQPLVINTTADESSTHWIFVKTELSAAEIEEAQLAYQAYTDIKTNASSYTTKMAEYFTDASSSELKPNYQGMSDTELRTSMEQARLPEYLIRIALKVKNNTWNEEDDMSRDFRVADYQVYSHYLYSKDKMGMGYCFGRLSNPTGIVVKPGDVVTVFCNSSAPSGCDLQLEAVPGTEAAGTSFSLSKGINIFTFTEDATLYVFYQTKDTKLSTKLSTCPDVRIHFEGGRLNGYYDKTRGHNDATWKHLREQLLRQSDVVNIKTPNIVFCMNSDLVQKACPSGMERLLKAWDDMVDSEDELMGYNDTYIPGLSQVQRNIYNFFSKSEYIGGLMMAGLYGVQCMESSISSIMNPDAMNADGVWGPAHECGHLRQNLISMLGTLESSNNLFSNVAVFKQGRTTQRAAAPQTIFDHFANHTPWLNYDIWETTHMFYQFYLYFHVNGIMPDFYQRVFTALRKNPMDHSDRSNMHGSDEYLKLARTFCDVAQADLSEVFAAYGFFEPIGATSISENGSMWTISTTQNEINETLEYMHKYPKKLGNILFIEDRVSPVLATYEGHKEGEYKKRRSDDLVGSNATAGDVGQYATYLETPSLPNYYYTITSTGKVTIEGSGAQGLVGFKVYDEDNQLAFVSNRLSFTLPSSLRTQNYTLVAAMGDGTDIVLTTELPEGIQTIDCRRAGSYKSRILRDLQGRPILQPLRGSLYLSGSKKILR